MGLISRVSSRTYRPSDPLQKSSKMSDTSLSAFDPNFYIGKKISDLPSPSVVVDLSQVRKNCQKMKSNAKKFNLKFRSHIKTHKNIEITKMASNDDGFVVSSLKEANELFKAGFEDVLYGVPLGVDKIGLAEELLMKNYDLHVFVDSVEILELIMAKSKFNSPLGKWSIFIKIDCENGRAGIKWNDEKSSIWWTKF